MISPIQINWPSVIEFGAGKLQTLEHHLIGCNRVFILADPPMNQRAETIAGKLNGKSIEVLVSTHVVPEPPFEALESLLKPVNEFKPDAVVGIGGGSAMDMAKLVSVLFDSRQNARDIIGIDKVEGRHVRLITVSTTSGTGSEVTPIAVLTDLAEKLKKGVVSKFLVPDVSIVDPELTLSLPAAITASTGMDAMTHCIEAYTNRYAHPIIDNIALEGIRLISANLENAVRNGQDMDARTALALGSLYGGMCLGPVNTAAVHALAYPLGGEFKISHGVSNSVLLPFIMIYNLPECVEKYACIGEAVGVKRGPCLESMARQGISAIRELSRACGIPQSLKSMNIPETAILTMAEAAIKVTRLLGNNPRHIEFDDAVQIYTRAYRGILE